ncbi:hypothetical protein OOK31_13140 [Streptomyces sp. NBC_00249]|uniref:hypothetical protein n=1 Tax=Streptomyces sp. NBC_00249 TaxID=2975690 RepID=UPI00224D1693|nr:hypothetical protein [Streptomyces sp. NBC_00249]MCX5194833.1 hypothetical protein [Streptomyces sp. NBC_00249]
MNPPASTLAFVESPVQLLNVLEWAHAHRGRGPLLTAVPAQPGPLAGRDGSPAGPGASGRLRIVVLPPVDPMSRGQLRRIAGIARDEGHAVHWQEARGGSGAPFKALAALGGAVRRAERIVVGDPFSRFVQLLLVPARAAELVVVDDGTATMEFVAQLGRGERLRRWHRSGGGAAARVRELVYAPVSGTARRRLTPRGGRGVELFTSMPVEPLPGTELRVNDFAWTRSRFGPPRLTKGTDLVGTSLVETGVVDPARYLEAVCALTREHGVTRYFAHRREAPEKLRALSEATGLEIVRPDLPLELIARRGPIGRTIVSFPSTVVHTLPYALTGTGVTVAVCDIDPAWLTAAASPRARSFLAGVTDTARDVRRLPAQAAPAAG